MQGCVYVGQVLYRSLTCIPSPTTTLCLISQSENELKGSFLRSVFQEQKPKASTEMTGTGTTGFILMAASARGGHLPGVCEAWV